NADPKLKLDEGNPSYGPGMRQAVKLFQARHVDPQGRPLKQDGEVGAITWSVLFGTAAVLSVAQAVDPLLA
ncbi:peptidoglycan-binding domain-containing protein, partial [Roseateles sp. GG27B]